MTDPSGVERPAHPRPERPVPGQSTRRVIARSESRPTGGSGSSWPTAPPLRTPLAPEARARIRRQRTRRRRTIIGVIVGALLLNLVAAGGFLYVKWRLGQIDRVKIPGLSEDTETVMNVLLVGSDSRDRLTGDAAAQAGKDQVSGQRSDTIMVLHIDSRQKRAAIMSIPRDLYVPIAGTGRSDRVNSAFSTGGPTRLAATIQESLGIQVNHFAEVDFVGFSEIVNAVGGVDIYVPAPARDAFSGLQIGSPGCYSLDGIAALAWVRSRNYEYLSDGRWVSDPRGDFGRIQRQQDFMRRVMKKAVSTGLTNPLRLNRLIGIGVDNITIDDSMSTTDITRLARRFNSLDPDKVETLTLPGEPTSINGASVIELNRAEAQPLIDRINGKTPPPPEPEPEEEAPPTTAVNPAEIDVRVLNGNGTPGAASKTAGELKAVGYTVIGTGDAPEDYTETLIRYGSDKDDIARQLQGQLAADAELEEDSTLSSGEVVLILGDDYSGLRAEAATPAAPTSTLVPSPVPDGAPAPTC